MSTRRQKITENLRPYITAKVYMGTVGMAV